MTALKLYLLPILIGLGLSAITSDQQPISNIQYPRPTGPSGRAVSGKSAAEDLFKYIRCHRQAKNIVVNFGTTSSTAVDHFVIYHSEVGDLFDPLEEVYPDGTLKYSYKHEQVFPGYHYYYISAVMTSGPPVNSLIDVVRIVGH